MEEEGERQREKERGKRRISLNSSNKRYKSPLKLSRAHLNILKLLLESQQKKVRDVNN
jgi:hypothetical protein